jgi:hypothetical protein
MANKKGNPDIVKYGFKKGKDWKGNAKGAPKKLPRLKALMDAMLGGGEETDITKTPIAKVVQALIDETTNKSLGAQRTQAAREILERAFGKAKPVNDIEQEEPIQWNETKTYEQPQEPKGKRDK